MHAKYMHDIHSVMDVIKMDAYTVFCYKRTLIIQWYISYFFISMIYTYNVVCVHTIILKWEPKV